MNRICLMEHSREKETNNNNNRDIKSVMSSIKETHSNRATHSTALAEQ